MEEAKDYLKDLNEIRSIMERSSRFISLSGLAGVMAGIYALVGGFYAYRVIYYSDMTVAYAVNKNLFSTEIKVLILDAVLVMVLALGTGIVITTRKAKKRGLTIWNSTVQRLMINLMIPLLTGGIFIVILFFRGYFGILSASTLIFYGLSLVNASKYTLSDIRHLGLTEILLGLCALAYPGFGLLFWILGFGVCHIVYGAWMYFKYDK